ncbi:polyhydroxyalkanoate synthesis repressor PhaR [Halorhodospira abdelmalekii]|uniref:polyhydroxyalkanoate synthesis repressor PhaR n=1 Tax=Halorhodospira abdelmalekii TaxID=421629 RepID=UPI0019085312|nr:polyhydroxyalkanoate synthesis repressor PhaR [Halorhodospira abdelmalekii]MBK1734119.1 polyhydroxyalkanoate synthesis repressor PhaR [Halorhodospira abdelmalekii]
MSEPRTIKKYPNRRLYDTAISSYITLADVKHLVLEGVDFQVIDAKSHEDLTRSILLQIISEEEEGGRPIFSSQLLAQLIRAYGGNMQSMLTSYLEKSLELWGEQQRAFHERTRELMDHNPMTLMTQIAESNLTMWRQLSGQAADTQARRRTESQTEGAAQNQTQNQTQDHPQNQGQAKDRAERTSSTRTRRTTGARGTHGEGAGSDKGGSNKGGRGG